MQNIYTVSDWHYKHKLENSDEQSELILDNHNAIVKPNDLVYFVGDLSMKRSLSEYCLKNMNGKIHFILGNHDYKFQNMIKNYVESISQIKDIKINGQKINFCHFPGRVWNCSHFGSFQIFGHCHGSLTPIGLQHDVYVEKHDYKPYHIDEIFEIMKTKRQHHYIDKDGKEIIEGGYETYKIKLYKNQNNLSIIPLHYYNMIKDNSSKNPLIIFPEDINEVNFDNIPIDENGDYILYVNVRNKDELNNVIVNIRK